MAAGAIRAALLPWLLLVGFVLVLSVVLNGSIMLVGFAGLFFGKLCLLVARKSLVLVPGCSGDIVRVFRLEVTLGGTGVLTVRHVRSPICL